MRYAAGSGSDPVAVTLVPWLVAGKVVPPRCGGVQACTTHFASEHCSSNDPLRL
jgi:hypothetical protein